MASSPRASSTNHSVLPKGPGTQRFPEKLCSLRPYPHCRWSSVHPARPQAGEDRGGDLQTKTRDCLPASKALPLPLPWEDDCSRLGAFPFVLFRPPTWCLGTLDLTLTSPLVSAVP